MDDTTSIMTATEFRKSILDNLIQLEKHVRVAGEITAANRLRQIIDSPDHIISLQTVLARGSQRSRKVNKLPSSNHAFFARFQSRGGQHLTDKQIVRLVRATKGWELNDICIEELKVCALLWEQYPKLFWLEMHEQDVTRQCVHNMIQMRNVGPSKGKVYSTVLSRRVEEEQSRLHTVSRIRDKKSQQPGSKPRQRETLLLQRAISNLVSQLWPDFSEIQQKGIRDNITIESRNGWRWCQLEHIEMALSLYQVDCSKYESGSWSDIEYDAINAFMKILPQFRIRHYLEKAWRHITAYYYRKWRSDVQPAGTEEPVLPSTVNSGQYNTSNFSLAVPLTVAPSRCSRKRHARVSDLSAKRRRTISSPGGRTLDSSHQRIPESRGDSTGRSAEPEGRTEDRLESLEIRALQPEHSSVPTEASQPHTQCFFSALCNDGSASSIPESFTTPHNHRTPMHVSQVPLQYDGMVSSQQTMTVAPLGLPVFSSQNPSFSNSSVPSEPAEQASVAAPQLRNDMLQQNISIGASLNYEAIEADQIPSVQRDLNKEHYFEAREPLQENEPNTSNTSFDAVQPDSVLNRPYIPGSCDLAEELHAPIQYSYQPGTLDINTENLYPPYEPGDLFDMNSWLQLTMTDSSFGIAAR